MTTADRNAVAFFYQHACWGYNPATETKAQGRHRGARNLADAEAWARTVGMTFVWEDDDIPWDGDSDSPREMLGCIARWRDGSTAASLWGLADPNADYVRVVESELSMEARAEMRASLEEAL